MNRAITFCAIVLGIPAVTCAAVSSYMSTRYVPASEPAPADTHPTNGLECTMERADQLHAPEIYKRSADIRHVEFLPNNKFRVVDEEAKNNVLAQDYIGVMETTDTTYTFGSAGDWVHEFMMAFLPYGRPLANDFAGLVVDRATTKLYEHHIEPAGADNLDGFDRGVETTITGWCTPAYVPPRPVPKKL